MSSTGAKAKTHQSVDSRYMKEFSLTDESAWSAVAAKKEDAAFKILRIRKSPTVSAALDFMLQAKFYETFNQASHWFFIVIEVDDGSTIPSQFLERLSVVFDEQKPVIIQWDLMQSKKHSVCFKPTGQCFLTTLPMNSVSQFGTKGELIDQLLKQDSFQLPLLLNALNLGIGGHFKGDASNILNVTFDVNQEIGNWRLIDYAARDDDSLSLRFLLLVDWDLAYENEDQRTTLEIATEFGGPQSISALLNLPITSSAEQLTLSDEKKNLLALTNVNGDNPLLIAAQKKNPDTLKFLIRCNIDLHCHRTKAAKVTHLHCHRTKEAKVTAICLAWDKKCFENMHVLLEADSNFPDDFDISVIEENKNTATLLKHIKYRQMFHQAIKEGSQRFVKAFIEHHPRLKRAYDPSNCCALITALKASQYDLFALLWSEGLRAGSNKELSEVIDNLSEEERERLNKAIGFERQVGSHIKYLHCKSKLRCGPNNEGYFVTLLELYKKLDTITEISTILKVVEESELCEIIIDFDRDTIADVEPTQSTKTKGLCKSMEGRLCISGEEEFELLGTLAHELTHLALHVCYDNQCNSYEESDEERKSLFDGIVSYYCKKEKMDPIIKWAFGDKESTWPAELIVRVPHMLAYYKEQGKQLLTEQAPKLFQFYKQYIQEDLRRFIEKPAYFKARHEIQHLNKLLGNIEEIEQSKIWLDGKCLLNEDVINCQTTQILSSTLPQLTIRSLYQVIRRKQLSISDIRGGYIFVSAEQFRNEEKGKYVFKMFKSVACPTLIIDCSYKYYESAKDLWDTINSFNDKRRIIFIAVSDVAWSLQKNLKEYSVKQIEYNWSNLAFSSQNALLEKTVHFQGSEMSLNQLIPVDSELTKYLPLADLLGAETLEIGEPMMTSADSFVARCCSGGTFIHQVTIKHESFEQTSDLPATPEHKRALLGNTNARNSLPYYPENLDEFLQQAQYQKVMLIADFAGMGKTSVLTHLSKQIKQKFPTYWVVKIDLNKHTDVLKAQMKQKIGTIEFLSEKLLKLHKPFEKELFKQCCQGLEEATKVVLMFDGFDEISPKYEKTFLDLLQDLNTKEQPSIEHMWVTTRPHLRVKLKKKLDTFSYTLQPFSEENQVIFLSSFWLKKSQGLDEQLLQIYAKSLINELTQSICDGKKQFTGIPLHLQMLAKVFCKKAERFCLTPISNLELRRQLCLEDLFSGFISTKLEIFQEKGEIAADQKLKADKDDIPFTKNHEKLALDIIFPELEEPVIKLGALKQFSREQISRFGILQYVDNKPCFIHDCFAQYYVANYLVRNIMQPKLQNLLYNVLKEAKFQVIRLFMDGLLKSKPSKEILEQHGKQIYKIWNNKLANRSWEVKQNLLSRVALRIVFHQAAKEGNSHIIDFLLESLRAAQYTCTIEDLLQHKNSDGETACCLAEKNNHTETLNVLKRWAEEMHLEPQ